MRVAGLELHEIGPFTSAELTIPAPAEGQRGELVIFEGPNGSGKTTLVQAIACAAEAENLLEAESPLHPPRGELAQRGRSSRGPRVTTKIEAAGEALFVKDPGSRIRWSPAEGRDTPAAELLREYRRAASRLAHPLRWAAFAYRGHQATPIVGARGPAEIEAPPLLGALSFGAKEPASAHFGQLLINLDYEIARALRDARDVRLEAARREELDGLAAARRRTLDGIERALSAALARAVKIDFPFGQRAPTLLLDDEPVPLALLGEGLRSTLAWLADLLVRLHRVAWEDATRSPLEQDFWLILDEIDAGLDPATAARILPALRRVFPRARVYVTTRSPLVAASAGGGCVVSINPDAGRRVSGTILARRTQGLEPRAPASGPFS